MFSRGLREEGEGNQKIRHSDTQRVTHSGIWVTCSKLTPFSHLGQLTRPLMKSDLLQLFLSRKKKSQSSLRFPTAEVAGASYIPETSIFTNRKKKSQSEKNGNVLPLISFRTRIKKKRTANGAETTLEEERRPTQIINGNSSRGKVQVVECEDVNVAASWRIG